MYIDKLMMSILYICNYEFCIDNVFTWIYYCVQKIRRYFTLQTLTRTAPNRKQTARFPKTVPCNILETLKNVCDLDLNPMTLVFELDLDLMTYFHIKKEVNRPNGSKAVTLNYLKIHVIWCVWPWFWPDDLGTQTWPKYHGNLLA